MRIGIIDADLIGRKKHRFPNLACEKISAYWKSKDATVQLLLSYDGLSPEIQETLFNDEIKTEQVQFDRIYISKVFTDTPVPPWVEELKYLPRDETRKIQIGGTGFFFDDAPPLDEEIEHQKPDYELYDNWIEEEVRKAEAAAIQNGKAFNRSRFMVQFKEYKEYSIGFLTRGCFRQCEFCVNRKYKKVFAHSPIDEFFDESRKKICLLDDNFFGCGPHWEELLLELQKKGRPFKFKQGLDERVLSEKKCRLLFSSLYDGDYTFAFDNISDYDLIHKKLEMIKLYAPQYGKRKASIKFYVLVGFESTDATDIENAFKRIELLMRYQCIPYIMRYQNKNDSPWKKSKYRGMYIALARWANQPNFFKKMSFRQYCHRNQDFAKSEKICAPLRALHEFESENEKNRVIAQKYFDLKFEDYILEQ